ncbi:Protein-lysine N-methyltransferase [Quillaja saponaria]|nr:Protein-lysine N-methyltransferase [Quillaja saponaria]
MAEQGLDPSHPSCLHLVSAFLAMEPIDALISYARVCGCGSITEGVQQFIWDHCLSKTAGCYGPYLKNFLKKLITEVELNHGVVLGELYELYTQYLTSLKDNILVKGHARICKKISFLFPSGYLGLPSCPQSRALVVLLQCSLNMLEGDTGCSIWPSSLFLSEFVLSFPELFSHKSCFEVGSGVGLVGICLAHLKTSKVILSDGDLATLANMKFNLELNYPSVETDKPGIDEDPNKVKCIHLPWESASESELQGIMPDIVLGADVIYDPVCLPHLVRVLKILLNQIKPHSCKHNDSWQGLIQDREFDGTDQQDAKDNSGRFVTSIRKTIHCGASNVESSEAPVAYIACVIRNIDTFNCFRALVDQAELNITDLSDTLKPLNFLPYMQSYERASIRLLRISHR